MANFAVCHKACMDGLASAWVVNLHLPYTEIVFSSYNHEWKNDLKNRLTQDDSIYFVDFCPEPEDMISLTNDGVSFTVIDHHDSAERKIREYDEKFKTEHMRWCHFDMEKCGSTLAWQYFQKLTKRENERPKLLEYIEIADIWTWRNERDREIDCYIKAILPPHKSIDAFQNLVDTFDEDKAHNMGKMLYQRMQTEVRYTVSKSCLLDFDGQEILSVNASQHFSEVGHELATRDEGGIGLIYIFMPENNQVKFSVRSDSNGKANKFAAKFGGGGHPDAAGFYMDVDQFHKYLKTARAIPKK